MIKEIFFFELVKKKIKQEALCILRQKFKMTENLSLIHLYNGSPESE